MLNIMNLEGVVVEVEDSQVIENLWHLGEVYWKNSDGCVVDMSQMDGDEEAMASFVEALGVEPESEEAYRIMEAGIVMVVVGVPALMNRDQVISEIMLESVKMVNEMCQEANVDQDGFKIDDLFAEWKGVPLAPITEHIEKRALAASNGIPNTVAHIKKEVIERVNLFFHPEGEVKVSMRFLLESANVQSDEMDVLVYEASEVSAAKANNGGLKEQIKYVRENGIDDNEILNHFRLIRSDFPY